MRLNKALERFPRTKVKRIRSKGTKCPKGSTNQAGQRGLAGLSRHGPFNFREARPSTREKPSQIEIRHRPISRAIRRSRPREKSTPQHPAHRIQIGSRQRLTSLCIATLFGKYRFRGPGQPLSRRAQPGNKKQIRAHEKEL